MNTVTLPAPETTGADYFDLTAAKAALVEGRPLVFPPMELVHTSYQGRPLTFACNFARDPIQRQHRAGRFFDEEQLVILKTHLPNNAHVLDVGANVGNHALFFALNGASRVVVVEPNPLAQAPLIANIVLNGLAHVIALDALGPGLGAASETGLYMKRHDRNLGATKMKRGQGGDLEVHTGDDLFAGQRFDLIKIDVETMEMEVLAGLTRIIAANRPLIFIEIDNANRSAFDAWMTAQRYTVIHAFGRAGGNENLLVKPEDAQ